MMLPAKVAQESQDCVLDVDLGQSLVPGHAMALQFRLKGSPGWGMPLVTCELPLLNPPQWDRQPRLRATGPCAWEFRQNTFLREASGGDCPPGQYHIDIQLEWANGAAASGARQMHASLTLVVPPQGPGPREVVIEGEGVSIIDLDRFQLDTFDRVVVRAKDSAIVSVGSPSAPKVIHKAEERYFRLRLHEEIPGCDRLKLETIGPTRRQWLLFATRELHLGQARYRSRDPRDESKNDVVLVPMSPEGVNKQLSVRISGHHLQLELTSYGVRVHDCNSFNGTRLDGQRVLPGEPGSVGTMHVAGRDLEVGQALRLRLTPLLGTAGMPPLAEHMSQALGAMGGANLRTLAERAGLDALRMQRVDNLPEEEYVMLFRQVAFGSAGGAGSVLELPFPVGEHPPARVFHADDYFYLERLSSRVPVRVSSPGADEQLPERQPMLLRIGQTIEIGENRLRVGPCEQWLD